MHKAMRVSQSLPVSPNIGGEFLRGPTALWGTRKFGSGTQHVNVKVPTNIVKQVKLVCLLYMCVCVCVKDEKVPHKHLIP